jgi:hypothetical protein
MVALRHYVLYALSRLVLTVLYLGIIWLVKVLGEPLVRGEPADPSVGWWAWGLRIAPQVALITVSALGVGKFGQWMDERLFGVPPGLLEASIRPPQRQGGGMTVVAVLQVTPLVLDEVPTQEILSDLPPTTPEAAVEAVVPPPPVVEAEPPSLERAAPAETATETMRTTIMWAAIGLDGRHDERITAVRCARAAQEVRTGEVRVVIVLDFGFGNGPEATAFICERLSRAGVPEMRIVCLRAPYNAFWRGGSHFISLVTEELARRF